MKSAKLTLKMMVSKDIIKIHAPAKVNLTLRVTGKRDDGYHLLHSLTHFSDFGDTITLSPHSEFKFTIDSQIDGVPDDNNNLVIQCAKMLATAFDKPLNCRIHLDKHIPMGAGLGGGSSNAAATAKALLQFWDTTPPTEELNTLLLSLGADIPVCYYAKPCVFSGIGEIIEPVNTLPEMYLVLVHPNISTSTLDVFKNLEISNYSTHENNLDYITHGQNDLTEAAIKTTPIIKDVLQEISQTKDCLGHRMTGSGSCCFGIYKTQELANNATEAIQKERPNWWVRPVTLLEK